ncbi:MAG TPA: hypothetical protein VK206_04640 [Anaerolineales bacterium]|nr:hypothetical protein [Anaerolineales bacterium]
MTSEARPRAAVWVKRIRIILGIIILVISIVLLIWGFSPSRHEIRTQPISPTELQLPTPASFRIDTTSPLSASLPQLNPVF